MTRIVQTNAESRAKDAVAKYLQVDSDSFVARKVNDAPDLLFMYKKRLICAEVTQIPSAELIQYYHKIFEDLRVQDETIRGVEIIYAIEPHSWAAQAVDRKRSKLVQYKRNTGATAAWLILHSPETGLDNPFNENGAEEISLLKYGVTSVPSGFDRILYMRKDGAIVRLSRRGQKFAKPSIAFAKGYPSSALTLFTPIRLDIAESGERTYHQSGQVEMKTIFVPPIDPAYMNHSASRKPRNYAIFPTGDKQGGTTLKMDVSDRT